MALLVFAGCRFGGASADPKAWIELDSDAGAAGSSAGSGTAGTGAGSGAGQGSAGTKSSAGEGEDGAVASDDDDGGSAGGTCTPPSTPPAVCDPVKNTGCGMGMQCDVDLVATQLAGRCTFSAPPDGGTGCFASPFTQSCPPTQTCEANACRDICLCDADCRAGSCCSQPLGTQGWKLCAPCK